MVFRTLPNLKILIFNEKKLKKLKKGYTVSPRLWYDGETDCSEKNKSQLAL